MHLSAAGGVVRSSLLIATLTIHRKTHAAIGRTRGIKNNLNQNCRNQTKPGRLGWCGKDILRLASFSPSRRCC
jgi:hypothetical protein